jgi:hypothetical protein
MPDHRPDNAIGIWEMARLAMIFLSRKPWLTLKMFFKEIRRRLYSDEPWYVFQFDLENKSDLPELEMALTIRELARRDIPKLFRLRRNETEWKEVREMLARLVCIKASRQTLYVGVTCDDYPCCLCWLISPDGKDWLFRNGLQPLRPSEVLLDNIWTHPDFRGKRLMMFLTRMLFDKARQQGAQRAVAYIRKGNESSIAGARAIGWDPFLLRKVSHRMFRRYTTYAPISLKPSIAAKCFHPLRTPPDHSNRSILKAVPETCELDNHNQLKS